MNTFRNAVVALSLAAAVTAVAKPKAKKKSASRPRAAVMVAPRHRVAPPMLVATRTAVPAVMVASRPAMPVAVMAPTQAPLQRAPLPMRSQLPQNVITTLPLMFVGIYALEYERVLDPRFSFFLDGAYMNSTLLLATGAQIGLGARYYLFGEAPQGLFGSLQFMGRRYSSSVTTTDSLGTGLLLGYTFLVGNVLALSLGAGGLVEYVKASFGVWPSRIAPGLLFRGNVGFAF